MLKKLGTFFLDIVEVIVFAIAIFLFIYLLILQPHKIKGASMEPNFPDGQYLLTDKVSYRFGEPERGDVIVFEPPGNNSDEFIKRITALPGERVSIRSGKVFINDRELVESFIPEEVSTNGSGFLQDNKEVIVPQNSYFVLGDNRPHSSDSRTWGFVKKDKITGKAWFIYWPVSDIGSVNNAEFTFN